MLSILIFLTFFGTTSADDGWLAAAKGSYIDFDFEATPLEIKTNSKVGSNEKVYVSFVDEGRKPTGGVAIKFTSPPTLQVLLCYRSGSYKDFPTPNDLNLAADNNNVWRVTVTRTSGISLTVYCNDKELLNYQLSSSLCDTQGWSQSWNLNQKTKSIMFSKSIDTATDFYRAYPGPPKCEVPTIDDGKVSPSTDISPGSSYTVTCNGGFAIKGNSDISCTENNGKASLSASPSCEKELKCGAPTVKDGKVSPSTDISPGSSYTVTCNGGFTLKGNKDISCTENNGKASLSTSPSCEKDAKDDDKTKLSFANCLKVNAALLVVLITAALLI